MSSLTTRFPYREPLRTDTVIILFLRKSHAHCMLNDQHRARVVRNGKGRKKMAHS